MPLLQFMGENCAQAGFADSIARGYAGADYAINRYDVRSNGEFQKYSAIGFSGLNVRAAQLYLAQLVFSRARLMPSLVRPAWQRLSIVSRDADRRRPLLSTQMRLRSCRPLRWF
jgi:hypothetical protein